jgi:hypothetical protein
MLVHCLSGFNTVAPKADSRKASNHAGSTGLTGLTGVAGAHMMFLSNSNQPKPSLNKFSVRMNKTTLTLLTLFKASSHAGFSVTGFLVNAVTACKGA